MKFWLLLLLSGITCFGQTLLQKNVDAFIGLDIYENYYYLQGGSLFKSGLENDYLNIQYGTPDDIDISDPLQIMLLYKSFNKVVLLDNRLNFISEFNIPFGTQLIANAGKNKIWRYDGINMLLKIYNFSTQKTEAKSIPITNKLINLKGNLNKAIALNNNNKLYMFNFVAREIDVKKTNGILLPLSLRSKYYLKNESLFYHESKILKCPKKIETFEVSNHFLYFFKGNKIYHTPFPKN